MVSKKKKHILLFTRLMSGWEESFKTNLWEPRGTPTLYKLINALDKDIECNLSIALTPSSSDIKPSKFTLSGLAVNPNVLRSFNIVPARLRFYIQQFYNFLWVLIFCIQKKPDIIYFDRTNVVTAALTSRLLKRKTILRIMGATPEMKTLQNGKRFFHMLMRWAYRSNFEWVLCTQEGSDILQWTNSMLVPNVKIDLWINGVNKPINTKLSAPTTFQKDKVNLLFLGRLNYLKGCSILAESVSKLPHSLIDKWHLIIVGDGEDKSKMQQLFQDAGLSSNITFISSIPHSEVFNYLNFADIYISLNQQGNLSNSNLEAFISGTCSILPGKDSLTMIDHATESLFPRDAVCYIDRNNQAESLKENLVRLINNKEKRKEMSENLLKYANKNLISWDKRISYEIKKLKRI